MVVVLMSFAVAERLYTECFVYFKPVSDCSVAQESKIRLMYLVGVHLFSEDDIKLNSEVFNWKQRIEPIFDQSEEVNI